MGAINIKKLGLALGLTFALLYLGCVFVIAIAGRERTIIFFNSLMHGIDVTSIIRTDMPFWEMVIGIVEIFVLGWLSGATIASIYNLGLKREDKDT
ncbi:hypothetical protein GTO36_08325 [bacterium]|nr:hypothetical protein [bacterium]